MNFLLDFLPLLLFFAVLRYADANADWAAAFASSHLGFMVSGGSVGKEEAPILLATVVVILATLVQVGIFKLRGRKVHLILWISLAAVVVLGGATVWFHSPEFIKLKPTVAYWVMAAAFLLSQWIWRRNLLREVLGQEIQLPEPVWVRLNQIWVLFFTLMGVVNLYVAHNFSTSGWATFKVFGATGLFLVFTVAQGLYIGRHLKPDSP